MRIERTFTLSKIYMEGLTPPKRISEFYVTMEGSTVVVRLRRVEKQFFLTLKSKGLMIRDEWEQEIPHWLFRLLRGDVKRPRLYKWRYFFSVEDKGKYFDCFVDVFFGKLKGLTLLRVQFESEDLVPCFDPVLVHRVNIVKEVTHDLRYTDEALCCGNLVSVRSDL